MNQKLKLALGGGGYVLYAPRFPRHQLTPGFADECLVFNAQLPRMFVLTVLENGHPLTLTLYWSALAPPSRDYTVFTHILDPAGQIAVGWDNMPCLGVCPTTRWRVGRLVDDVHVIPLSAELPAGEYGIAFGLYSLETGERLPVWGAGDQQVSNATVVLSQRVRVRDE